ncbi:MAG: hypothetical protein M3P30_02145 [Chloroflexota bacterium]|nr:hypothetical protein [Chloroflexota bacterium]
MKRMTRAVGLEALSDLVEAPPRAYLAYVTEGTPEAVRVTSRRDADRWLVTLPPGTSIPDRARVVLLIDDGEFYFELRGIRVHGRCVRLGRNARSRAREDHHLGLRCDANEVVVTVRAAAAATADDPRVRDVLRRATIARIVTVTASGGH